jgi:ABC-type cobalamin/Fe3+-siderophores transport system ATPase subunit
MKIHEIKNDKYHIEPYKMANDALIKNVHAPIPNQYGFFMMVIGTPGSGKSTFWLNLITKKDKNTFYKKFDKIFIFSNSLKTITTKIHLPDDRLFDGISQLEDTIDAIKDSDDRVLLIIDDCVTDLKNPDYLLKLIYNRRHLAKSISIVITSQVYNKINMAIRKAASDLVLFSTTNKKELETVYSEYINIQRSDFEEVCRYCFRTKHDFLFYKVADNSYYRNFNRLELDF